MDLSELQRDSPIPLYSGIVGIATLPLPLFMLYCVFKSPSEGSNARSRQMLLGTWALMIIDHTAFIAYALLTPQCPVVYRHVYASYQLVPCLANAIYPVSFMAGPVGHFFATIVLLRRFRPILEMLSSRILPVIVRLGPAASFLSTLGTVGIEIWSIYDPVPSPSTEMLPLDKWFLSWTYVWNLFVHAIFCCICYVAAMQHVRKVLGEVDQAAGKSSTSIHEQTGLNVPTSHYAHSQASNRSRTPSQMPSMVTLAAKEHAQWRHVYGLSACCLAQMLVAVAYMCGIAPPILNLPVVAQGMITLVSIKTYLASEYLLMNFIRQALEMNRARRTATVLSLAPIKANGPASPA